MILKLKRTPGIYLVGYMGSGKSTIGRRLAEELGWGFVDLDEEIEAAEGRPIRAIFDQQGEAAFRRLEHEALVAHVRQIQAGMPTVLALGGGAFSRRENRELIADNGISIWLRCPVETLWERVSRAAHRPLARDRASFEELYLARRPDYELAEYWIEARSDNPMVAVAAFLELPLFR
jgi:shikimate kinase